MDNHNLRKFYWAAVILGIFLLGLLAWLFLDVRHLYRTGVLRTKIRYQREILMSPTQIQDWMTFRYINSIFRLPPPYLAQTLNITDAYYPNLVIGTYASSRQLNPAAFLESVKQAVTAYPAGGNK